MTCGLSKDELDILTYLYKGRCLSPDHSISLKAIERDLGHHITDLENKLDVLVAKRYLGCKKKRSKNYYAGPSPTIKAISAHGVQIWRGGRGKI
ncbi:MAG TPA: hypothetical protein PKO24_04330 [Methanomassiliicoccales archaeon]|jgi:hypothetical protein|nr:hypothetical protein [Euryarchaeota archaeon]HOE52841.1 hypothetical protein [Methanomassiliicoccales archaeon]HQN76409.1 hypothetical protein [Methanomassiliicoccales archaeon]HRR66320.1 hypothetical protein [Methanomassiliicoccales archaeon]